MGKLPSKVKRRLIVKSKSTPDPRFGKKPEERSIEEHIKYGIINLDKPPGPTSHEVVAWIKKVLDIKRAGHGGTLDPKVSGVLPIALEESTKIIQTLLPASKEYVCIMRLHGEVGREKVEEASKEFVGEIIQMPPVRSAVKRELRKREIYYINIFEKEGRDVLFKVGCEGGTYVRKLCHDIGMVLGCEAHMIGLRRTMSGSFREDDLVTLHDVTDRYHIWKENGVEALLREAIMPVEKAVEHLPKIVVHDSAVDAICHGADLAIPGINKLDSRIEKEDLLAIFTLKDELIAIGRAMMDTKDMLIDDKGIAVKTRRVIMKPDVYPKMWKTDT
ncbi:MAG: RNA-guided pseudouridylation complex pseudouridine synthase subunit Cbf5 [Candidatus Hydrothermarchaeales archaeon]